MIFYIVCLESWRRAQNRSSTPSFLGSPGRCRFGSFQTIFVVVMTKNRSATVTILYASQFGSLVHG